MLGPVLSLLLLASHDPVIEPAAACDYGENRPRLPRPGDGRRELYDLLLGQELRAADREAIAASLRQRLPGEATDAFLAIMAAVPGERDEHVAALEGVVRRYRRSRDPELQIEVARARFALIDAYLNRHVGALMDGGFVWTPETWRETAAGRRWAALLDRFLRDYRGRGAQYDEFVAQAEIDALFREAADRSRGDNSGDQRFLSPEDAPVRAWLLARMQALVERYEASPQERVQRVVADAIDMLARYEDGRAALVATDRRIIARYRNADDYMLRHNVNGAYHRLESSLTDLGDAAEAEAARRERLAFAAARLDIDCAPAGG